MNNYMARLEVTLDYVKNHRGQVLQLMAAANNSAKRDAETGKDGAHCVGLAFDGDALILTTKYCNAASQCKCDNFVQIASFYNREPMRMYYHDTTSDNMANHLDTWIKVASQNIDNMNQTKDFRSALSNILKLITEQDDEFDGDTHDED